MRVNWAAKLAADLINTSEQNAEINKPVELEYQSNVLTQLLAEMWVMGLGFKTRATHYHKHL
ncbi:MAG: hypothetical protein O6852_05830 [Gammaproteobacteria bacterium]|nr:hypothetical protein [Gammaproteobacteria bacterium]